MADKFESAIDTANWLTPPKLVRRMGVDANKIRLLIERGELTAINAATRLGGRPRWRIRPEDLAEFLQRRRSPAAPVPRQRRRRSPDVIQFF